MLPVGAWAGACPDIDGQYRVTGGPGPAAGEALVALDAEIAGFLGSEIKITTQPGPALALWFMSLAKGAPPARPHRVLRQGVDYDCEGGWVVVRRTAPAARRIDGRWIEGSSRLRLAPWPGGGLTLQVNFAGRERAVFYQYDSARMSVPKPFTGRTATESLRWPPITEPAEPPPEPPGVEPLALRQVRDRITPLLQGVRLAGLEKSGGAALATLRAGSREEAAQFEDRLRAAGVGYELRVPPVWSANAWHLEVLVRGGAAAPAGGATAAAEPPSRLSPSRIQQELTSKMQYSLVDVLRVEPDGEAYVATLRLLGDGQIAQAQARLRANSRLFDQVVLLGEGPDPQLPGTRLARWRLTLRTP